jgi:N-formylglutamate deformylase
MTEEEMGQYPKYTVLHIPHDSTIIPDEVMYQFQLDRSRLAQEIIKMTDWHTFEGFLSDNDDVSYVHSNVSRLVVDVERFSRDDDEAMSKVGMGVVYMSTADGDRLRKDISNIERGDLLEAYYHPHHRQFQDLVDSKLESYGKCMIIDCHSFPSTALPYELNQGSDRPEICIGSDLFHTPNILTEILISNFHKLDLSVRNNYPFSGSIVPLKHFRKTKAVVSFMIEINRGIYLKEDTGQKKLNFEERMEEIRNCCQKSLDEFERQYKS